MPQITISIDEEVKKILSKRAEKNLLTLKEQIEDILRESAVRTKSGSREAEPKIDDKLVSIFSRAKKSNTKK
ncbi:hypothetical protein J4411_01790 [Candidatus Pacearchaeota archaeon]|nr:hypothetical protein [Candidatus Pacearchaeota archaeon]